MGRKWLTVNEISQELGLHEMTVYRLIHAGKLGAVKVGRSYRVAREDFDRYLKGARTNAPQAGGTGTQAPELPSQ